MLYLWQATIMQLSHTTHWPSSVRRAADLSGSHHLHPQQAWRDTQQVPAAPVAARNHHHLFLTRCLIWHKSQLSSAGDGCCAQRQICTGATAVLISPSSSSSISQTAIFQPWDSYSAWQMRLHFSFLALMLCHSINRSNNRDSSGLPS